MNLDEFDVSGPAERGADVIIKHPVTGENTDIVVTVVGRDSPTYKSKALELSKVERDSSMSDDQWNEFIGAELMACCITDWVNLEVDSKPVPYTKDFAVEFLSKPEYLPLATQILSAIHDRNTFYSKKKTT